MAVGGRKGACSLVTVRVGATEGQPQGPPLHCPVEVRAWRPGPTLWAYNLCTGAGPTFRRSPRVFEGAAFTILKFLLYTRGSPVFTLHRTPQTASLALVSALPEEADHKTRARFDSSPPEKAAQPDESVRCPSLSEGPLDSLVQGVTLGLSQ